VRREGFSMSSKRSWMGWPQLHAKPSGEDSRQTSPGSVFIPYLFFINFNINATVEDIIRITEFCLFL